MISVLKTYVWRLVYVIPTISAGYLKSRWDLRQPNTGRILIVSKGEGFYEEKMDLDMRVYASHFMRM